MKTPIQQKVSKFNLIIPHALPWGEEENVSLSKPLIFCESSQASSFSMFYIMPKILRYSLKINQRILKVFSWYWEMVG